MESCQSRLVNQFSSRASLVSLQSLSVRDDISAAASQLLTDPDLNLSIHPARVPARRLPPSAEPSGSSRFDPVGPRSTTMTHPLRSMGIAPLRRYYEAVRPSPAHRYFQPHGWSRLCFFPWHRRPGSHVPYKSLVELRAASMPDAAWAVSVHPPS